MSMSSGAVCEWEHETTEVEGWEPEAANIEDVELDAEIERVSVLLEQTGESSEGSVPTKDTLGRAVSFLIAQSDKVRELRGLAAPVPDIDFGPNGSIDIHWRRRGWELLVNIPANPSQPAAFYGDDYGSQQIRGSFDPTSFNFGIATWLMSK
jgi:hypothetical protein